MPHVPIIKSAIKRNELAKARRIKNMSKRSTLRTILKKTLTSIAAQDIEASKNNLKAAIKALDKAAAKGLIHKNEAARRKSRLTKRYNALMAKAS